MTAVVIFQLSGCSAIIDAISVTGDVAGPKKAAKQKQIIILPSEVHTIKPGTCIYVFLRSGARVMGKYLDTELRKLALKLDSRIINDVR